MKQFTLAAQPRQLTGKKVKQLRAKGLIPGIIYGHLERPEPISVEAKDFRRVFQDAGTGTLVDLTIGEQKPLKVLIHEPQAHYLTGEPIHADFYAVKMDEEIETEIPIHFVGVAPAVEELEGNFISNKDELTIKCLPGDLIPSVEVDISSLKTFDNLIRVTDIKVPETIKVMDDPEETVALVTPPRSEEELEAELAEDKTAEEAAVEELGKELEDGGEGDAETPEAETPAEQPAEEKAP